MTKWLPITHIILQGSNISLHIVGDRYFVYKNSWCLCFTVRDEITTKIQKNQWIQIISECELIYVEINKYTVGILVENKYLMRDESFIRISNKDYSSHVEASQHYQSGYHPPVIKVCHISRMLLQYITIDISDCIWWYDIECINSNRLKRSDV